MRFRRTARLQLVAGAVAGAVLGAASAAHAQTVTTILKNGPDSEKKVVVVIGDGYAEADLPAYRTWVQSRFMDGMFAQDSFLRANQSAFNVYRVDVTSQDSGVSIKRYTAASCDTRTKSDDVAVVCNPTSTPPCYDNTTALGYVFTDCWGRCWMEGTANTESSIDTILDALVPKRDYEVRVLNVLTNEGGGCGGGAKLAVTSAENWQTLAHEFGHMISSLYDEYTGPTKPAYTGSAVNSKNCSTELNQGTVVWSDLVSPGISVPPATVYDAMTMDIDQTVGMFEGCKTYATNIYRPVQNCRMRSENRGEFCPVCQQVMSTTLSGFPDTLSDFMYYANVPGAMCSGDGVTYTSGAAVANGTTDSATVLCPARRVQDANGNFSNTVFGEAFVIDRNPTADVCCQVFGRTPNGNVVKGSNVCSSGSSTSDQRLRLDFPKVQQPLTFAHYAIKCTLPPASNGAASNVATYRIVQQRY